MHIHPYLTQQLVDDRRQSLLASARRSELRSTRRAPRARRSLRGRRA